MIKAKATKESIMLWQATFLQVTGTKNKTEEHTCINKAPKAAQDASSLIEPTQNFKAAQSTNAKPNTLEPFPSRPS